VSLVSSFLLGHGGELTIMYVNPQLFRSMTIRINVKNCSARDCTYVNDDM